MYFENRIEAGQILAKKLQQYKLNETAVIALSAGGVLVAEFVAKELGAPLTLLLSREIGIPGEPMAIGTISQHGDFSYNTSLQKPVIQEFEEEFHTHIEAEKMNKLYELNRATGKHKSFDRHIYAGKNVILVSDGIMNAAVMDAAYEYLKPVAYKKLIAATALASVDVVDRMHILADEIQCLSVVDGEVFDVDHYYNDNEIPEESTLLDRIDQLATT